MYGSYGNSMDYNQHLPTSQLDRLPLPYNHNIEKLKQIPSVRNHAHLQNPLFDALTMSEAPVNRDSPLNDVKAKFQNMKKIAAKKSMQSLDNMYGNVLTSPAPVVILLIII